MKTREFIILSECTNEDMQAKLSRLQRPFSVCGIRVPEDLNSLTMGEIIALQAIETEADAITVPCKVILGLDERKVMDAEASEVFGFIVWVAKEMERINKLFERTNIPPTKEEKEAGVEDLNFGAFGILDWYARRMGIVDHEFVEHVKWPRIYKCLEMDAKQFMYERRLKGVYQRRNDENKS